MFPNVIVPFLRLFAVLWLIVPLCGGCHFMFFFLCCLLTAFHFREFVAFDNVLDASLDS